MYVVCCLYLLKIFLLLFFLICMLINVVELFITCLFFPYILPIMFKLRKAQSMHVI